MSVIYYQKFSENEVFADALLNITFNQIYTFLINVLGEELVTTKLLIDNDVAFLLQGASFTTEVSKIELITANKEIFNLLKTSYSSFKVSQVISADSSLTMVINDKLITVNFSPIEVPFNDVMGIYVKAIK